MSDGQIKSDNATKLWKASLPSAESVAPPKPRPVTHISSQKLEPVKRTVKGTGRG